MKLTKNFDLSEFECKCNNCKMPENVLSNIIKLSNELQFLRNYVDRPIKINSAYRCIEHNKKIGGAYNSQHLLGKASDIVIQSVHPFKTYELINELIDMSLMLQGGLGKYKKFTHYDIRKTKARWMGN